MIPRARMLLVERVIRNVNTCFKLMNLWQMQCQRTPNDVRNILLILIICGNLKSEGCQTSLFFSCWYQYLNIIHRLKTSLHIRRFFFRFQANEVKREASEEHQTRACLALLARIALAFARLKNAKKNNAFYAGELKTKVKCSKFTGVDDASILSLPRSRCSLFTQRPSYWGETLRDKTKMTTWETTIFFQI